jgi:hypothetical protein
VRGFGDIRQLLARRREEAVRISGKDRQHSTVFSTVSAAVATVMDSSDFVTLASLPRPLDGGPVVPAEQGKYDEQTQNQKELHPAMIGIIGADENHRPRFVLCLVCNARVRAAGTPDSGEKQGRLDGRESSRGGIDRDADETFAD